MAEEKTTPSKLEELKIKQSNFPGIVALKDRPNAPTEYGGSGLSAEDLKKAFDEIPIAALEGLNKLIDFLKDTDYSAEIKIREIKIGDWPVYKNLDDLIIGIFGGYIGNRIYILLDDTEYTDKLTQKTLTARIEYLLSQISDIQTKKIPGAIDDLKGGDLPDGYKTLVEIAGKVKDAASAASTAETKANAYTNQKIDNLLNTESLDGTYNTLKEIDAYIQEHGEKFAGVLKNISTLGVTVATLAANVNANKGRIDTVEPKVNTVINTTIPTEIKGAKLYTDQKVSALDEKVNNNYNSLGMAIDDAKASAEKYTDEQIAKVSGSDTTYVEDSEEKHIKIIPSGAYPYAFVNKIGGKTEKVARKGENVAELSASNNVTLSNGEFTVTIPPESSGVLFNGVGLSANLNPYIRYAINKHDTTMPSGCSVFFEYYLSGEDADGNLISSNIGSPNSVLPYELGFVKNVNLSIDLSYYTNTTSASKTVKFSLSVTPKIEKLVSAPVKSVISQGRNLVDDVDVFRTVGYKLQENGYWLAEQSKVYRMYTNTNKIPGKLSVTFKAKVISFKEASESPPLFIRFKLSDGISVYAGSERHGMSKKDYYTIQFTTDGRLVDYIELSYSQVGSYEIKDLMVSFGDTPLPYEPYTVSARGIPPEITSKNGYGEGGNVVDFDELIYSRTRGRRVFTGADSEGWGRSTSAPYMYYTTISDKAAYPCSQSNYFNFAGEAEGIENPVSGTFTEWYGDKDIGYYSDISSVEEWKAYLAALNAAGAPLTVVYDLENPEMISLSEASDINPITIANGDMVIFENAENLDMPNTIEYVKRVKEADV